MTFKCDCTLMVEDGNSESEIVAFIWIVASEDQTFICMCVCVCVCVFVCVLMLCCITSIKNVNMVQIIQ